MHPFLAELLLESARAVTKVLTKKIREYGDASEERSQPLTHEQVDDIERQIDSATSFHVKPSVSPNTNPPICKK